MNDFEEPHEGRFPMARVPSSAVNGADMAVAAMLVVLGIIAYMQVGGPVAIAGGLVVALLLFAYRRTRRRAAEIAAAQNAGETELRGR
jgi:hypothetical protein